MNSIPSEVLEVIFIYLPNNRLWECMKVCKLWYSIGLKTKYEEIDAYGCSIENLQITRVDGNKAGDSAKTCRLYGCDRFTIHDFQELMHCLPNLKVIKGLSPRHLTFLSSRNILDRLTCLEEVSLNAVNVWDQSCIDFYWAINVRLKNQITSLTLKRVPLFVRDGDYQSFATLLFGFHALKKLILWDVDDNVSNAINLASILINWSSLQSLELRSTCSMRIVHTTAYAIHRNLTTLAFHVHELTETHLEFISQYLPNLKNLTLFIDNDFKEVLTTSKPSTVRKFAVFLKKIKNLLIEQRSRSAAIIASNVDNSIEIPVFWRFLRDFWDKDYYCELWANVSSPEAASSALCLKKQNRYVYLRCPVLLASSDSASWVQQLDFSTFKSFASVDLRVDYSQYDWIQSLIILFIQQKQQHKHECEEIHIQHSAQEVRFIKIRNKQDVTQGYVFNSMLRSETLNELGQLYPLVEELELKKCMIKSEDNEVEIYKIDLSQFRRLGRFSFDLDTMLPRNKTKMSVFIKFRLINVVKSGSCDCFYYNESNPMYNYHRAQERLTTAGLMIVLTIYHSGIDSIIFKRLKDTIQITR